MRLRVLGLACVVLLFPGPSCRPSDNRETAVNTPGTSRKTVTRGLHAELRIIAHRGNSSEAPENTVAAIESAIALGVDLIEVDVRLTSDGVPVIFHDATVDRTTDGHGALDDMTLAELKALDAGAWMDERFRGQRIPTLGEALQAVQGKAQLLLDVPVEGIAHRIAAVFHSRGLSHGEAVIGTWSPEQRAEFKRHMPEATLFLSEGAPQTWDSAYFARQRDAGVSAFEIANWSPAFIEAAHTHQMPVYVYTVNDEPTMRVLIESGADGIETDVPRLAIRVAQELGVRRKTGNGLAAGAGGLPITTRPPSLTPASPSRRRAE